MLEDPLLIPSTALVLKNYLGLEWELKTEIKPKKNFYKHFFDFLRTYTGTKGEKVVLFGFSIVTYRFGLKKLPVLYCK
jgi:hypothetical protein